MPCLDAPGPCVVQQGVTHCPSTLSDTPIIVAVSLLGSRFALYLLARVKVQLNYKNVDETKLKTSERLQKFHRELLTVFRVLMTLLDFTTDVLFAHYLYIVKQRYESNSLLALLFVLSVVSLVTPVVLNFLFMLKRLNNLEMIEFWYHFKCYPVPTAIVLVLSCTNVSLFNVCSSNILRLSMFRAKVPPLVVSKFRAGGVTSNIFEDIPQLVCGVVIL